MGRIALALALLLNQGPSWSWAGVLQWGNSADPFYNAKTHPLPQALLHLLMDNHYFVHSDGSIWSPLGREEIRKSQMRVLIRRLKSSERLKSLLNIDLILSENGSQRLTPDELKKIRHILKLTWPYFTLENRKHFARYFSREELYSMNETPPDEESDPDLLAQEPLGNPPPPVLPTAFPSTSAVSVPSAEISENAQSNPGNAATLPLFPTLNPAPAFFPAAASAVSQAALAVSAALVPNTVNARVSASPIPATTSAAPPRVAPNVLPRPALISKVSESHAVAAPAAPLSPVVMPANVSGREVPGVGSSSSAAKTGIDPNVLKQVLAASSVARLPKSLTAVQSTAPVSLPPLEASPAPPVAIIASADFEKFLMGAPYSGDAKGLLRLIEADAQEPFRSRALNTVMKLLPAIVLDPDLVGLSAHEKTVLKENPGESPEATVLLNPNPALATKKEFFFEEWKSMIASSSDAYKTLGLPLPQVQALNPEARPDKTESGSWGRETQVYSDESLRGNFSSFEMSGFLLHALLEIEAKLEGWSAFPYQEQSYAYSGQMLLYAQIKDGAKTAKFLDPQMRALFEDWLSHPARFHDFLIHSLSAGQNDLWDLRHIELSRRDYFIRKSYVACPQSLSQTESLARSARWEALKKGAMSLARAHLYASSDFEKALKFLDARAGAFDAKKPVPTLTRCESYWRKEFSGSNAVDGLLEEAQAAEQEFRKKTGVPYVP